MTTNVNVSSTGSCPDIGALRAWLDHEESDNLSDHLARCPGCQRLVSELRERASTVGEDLALLAPSRLPSTAEVALARERMDWRRRRKAASVDADSDQATHAVDRPWTRLSTRWRLAGSAIAAGVTLALVIAFTPQGGSAAAAFLAQFRSQQVTPIAIGPQSQADIVKTLNALGNLGTIQSPNAPAGASPAVAARAAEREATRVVTLAEATQTVGFQLLMPDPASLPADVGTAPTVHVVNSSQVRFTFDKKKAQAYFQSTGHPEVSLPDKFDGASLVVSVPAAAVLEYGTGNQSTKNAVVIGEANELVVDVQGNVSLQEMRDFLLGLPGLPADVVNQLKQIQNWSDTLPIPVPASQVNWQSATIHGSQGLLLNDNSNVGSAAVWHANGHLFGVAGSLKASDLKRIADGLH